MDDFEEDFYRLLSNAFYGKTMENVRNRIKVKFIKKVCNEKITKQQSKSTFIGKHKSLTNYDSYTFKQSERLIDEPFYLGFTIVKLGKSLMYET